MVVNDSNVIISGFKAFFDVVVELFTYNPTATVLSFIVFALALYSITSIGPSGF